MISEGKIAERVSGWSGIRIRAEAVTVPRPPSALAEKAYQTYVIPNMFAKAVQGASDSDAIAFAIKALTDIGYSK